MNELDQIKQDLVAVNKYLDKHVLEIYYLADAEGNLEIPTNVKVKLTGMKHYLDMGVSKPFAQFTAYILPTNKNSDRFNSILSAQLGRETEIKTFGNSAYWNFEWVITRKLSDLLKYFSLPDAILTKVVNEVEPMKLNENLIVEAKYDNVVRTLVKDITQIFKYQRQGEWGLPEDLRPEEMTYTFPEIQEDFSILLELEEDENIKTFDVDADWYADDDVMLITIKSNPNAGYSILQDVIKELNEVIRHELEHIRQRELGYEFPEKEPESPYKYYTQQHELEAQRAGFMRRARKEKVSFEALVRDWFRRNQHKHNMTPKKAEKVIQQILNKK
jgi:hypothetical protein